MVWENFSEDYCTPALFERDYMQLFGNYFDSLLSDPLLWNILSHYLMNLFFLWINVGAMDFWIVSLLHINKYLGMDILLVF